MLSRVFGTETNGITRWRRKMHIEELYDWVQVKVTLEQPMKAQRESRGIAVFLFEPWRYMGWVVNATPHPLYSRGRNTIHIAQETGWDPGQVWMDVEILSPLEVDPRTVQIVASRYSDGPLLYFTKYN
jgi:hypothetical protein